MRTFHCPVCGVDAKYGGNRVSAGQPVMCPEHGRVFVTNKLPILDFLTRPLTSKDGIKRAQKALHQRTYRAKNPEQSKQQVLNWRARNTGWSQRSNKKRWQELSKDPLALAERNRKRREWRATRKEVINERKRETYKRGLACQE